MSSITFTRKELQEWAVERTKLTNKVVPDFLLDHPKHKQDKIPIDEKRAISIHAWLSCNHEEPVPERTTLWKIMTEIDPTLFDKKADFNDKGCKNGIDRMNEAYQRLYGEKISFVHHDKSAKK